MNGGSIIVFIRKDIQNYFDFRGKHSIALKPHSEAKFSDVFEANFKIQNPRILCFLIRL